VEATTGTAVAAAGLAEAFRSSAESDELPQPASRARQAPDNRAVERREVGVSMGSSEAE
jgi:hypothetical protein